LYAPAYSQPQEKEKATKPRKHETLLFVFP
jgi:hypothetical protein